MMPKIINVSMCLTVGKYVSPEWMTPLSGQSDYSS